MSTTTAQGARTGAPELHPISMESPWRWLAAAWQQIWQAPRISLTYGFLFAAASGGLFAMLFVFNLQAFILPLVGGFLILGPMLAVGLYEGARRAEAGEPTALKDVLFVKTAAPSQLAFMGVLLMIAYFAWARLAALIFMFFHGVNAEFPPLEAFFADLFFTWNGIAMLVVGTAVGGAIAFAIFAVSAISVPMMMVRDVDAVTAGLTSIRAVKENFAPMLIWGWLILLLIAFGVATAFVGLIVTFPLVGFATWHAYRELTEGKRPA